MQIIRERENASMMTLIYVYSAEVKSQGFTVLIDMRSNSNTAATTKAILKVLQEHVGPELVSQVIIIKSDNFWHKQRAAITSSHKYKFEVILFYNNAVCVCVWQMKTKFYYYLCRFHRFLSRHYGSISMQRK